MSGKSADPTSTIFSLKVGLPYQLQKNLLYSESH